MYEIGKVYIWQNQTGQFAYLNGVETTVTSEGERYVSLFTNTEIFGWPTDTFVEKYGRYAYAEAGDLRRKDPPAGERSILDLFKLPEMEPA